jgi:hypothetical protein
MVQPVADAAGIRLQRLRVAQHEAAVRAVFADGAGRGERGGVAE